MNNTSEYKKIISEGANMISQGYPNDTKFK